MPTLPKGIFITGTDTGVGKTVVTSALGSLLKLSGLIVIPFKPIQTGTKLDATLDIEFIQKVMGTDYLVDTVCPYRFTEPLAPMVAAEIDREKIEIGEIIEVFNDLCSLADIVLVEGAGGLVVPINDNYYMADLALELGLELIIVTRPGLGTLNHTLLTTEYARRKGLGILGLVINNYPTNPSIDERTNPEMILKMTNEQIIGILPHDPEISAEEGGISKIRELAVSSFTPEFGGMFDLNEFLAQVKGPAS